jgi:predicted  nucleic acid-binding Zn-ribbon protein
VNDQLRHLIELQQIDSKILGKKHIMDEVPAKILKAEEPFKESLSAFNKRKQRHESLEKKKRDKERELDDINEKIKKLKARTAEIKTNKEYQAHLKEIEAAEKERYSVEDEILILMEEIDASSKEIRSEEVRLTAERDKIETSKKKLEKEALEVEEELLAFKEARSRVVDVIDGEIYDQYITLLELNDGIAVTDVKEAVCKGCNMNIPPQLFVEIKKNEEVIQCPQCHRILYYKNDY